MIPFSPFSDFESASAHVLEFLHARLGFKLWMVTRKQNENWIVLNAKDEAYSVKPQDVFEWTSSFCSRMVEGLGPCIAPDSDQIPAYTEAPIGQQVSIRAYIGVPLILESGELFGTLCAIDPEPKHESITDELPLVQMSARLLATILESEMKLSTEMRISERALNDSMKDPLTSLYNRRGWKKLVAAEEARCIRYGHPAGIISIDLDNLKTINDSEGHLAGDRLIKSFARILTSTLRKPDIVARVGGDEFAVLVVETNHDGTNHVVDRIRKKLSDENIKASIGWTMLAIGKPINDSLEVADQRMYEDKRVRSLATPVLDSSRRQPARKVQA